jgi:hypothetical protein
MIRPARRMLVLALLLPVPLAATGVDELAWLAGSWRLERSGTTIEEHWLPPAGGMLLGVSRTVRADGGVEFEFLRIAEHEGGLAYLASPEGRPATPFRLVELEGSRATFENPANDFPSRLVYERAGETLTATISGTIDGAPRSLAFEWRLVREPLAGP